MSISSTQDKKCDMCQNSYIHEMTCPIDSIQMCTFVLWMSLPCGRVVRGPRKLCAPNSTTSNKEYYSQIVHISDGGTEQCAISDYKDAG